MRDFEFQIGDYCHVFNRGAGKQVIYQDQNDYKRFYQSLFLFNSATFKNTGGHTDMRDDVLLEMIDKSEPEREPFVEIISYCLLPNHFHLLLKQVRPDGIPIFLHKLSMGYSKYFNLRHKRSGTLYEGTYKAVLVEREGHLEHLPRYIHLNALDTTSVDWRNHPVNDWSRVKMILDSYPWSSHHVYAGGQEPLRVIHTAEIKKWFPETDAYWNYIKEWVGTSLSDVPTADDL